MKKRFLCITLAAFMIVSMIPTSAFAATSTYNYRFQIQTRDVKNAGTDSQVNAGFEFHDYGNANSEMDTADYNDFERGDNDTYSFSTNKADPWMIKEVYLKTNGKGSASTWMPGTFNVKIDTGKTEKKRRIFYPYAYYDSPIYRDMGTVDFSGTELDGGSATRNFSNMTKRKISSWGNFDSWNEICYLNGETKGSLSKTWDGIITDQYGTYNPFSLDDAPTLSVTSSNDAISATSGCYTFTDGKQSTPSFNIDYEKIYKEMLKENIGKVIFTINLNFPARTTYTTEGYSNFHTETITVYRRCFETGNQSIDLSPVYSPRADFNYFNNDYDDVTITLEPTTIHLETPSSAQKKAIANNFSCTAELYAGNDTTKKLCDMAYTKSDGVLTFTGTIPKAVTTNGEGVMLYLSNVYSEYGGYKYDLNSGKTTVDYYFSTHKADTVAPTVSTVDDNTTAYSVTNHLESNHKFYIVGSETLYPEKGVEHNPSNEGYFNYELYKYNENTNSYSNDKTEITNYNGSTVESAYTTVKAPIGTTVLKDTPINLKLYNKDEGKFKLRLYAYDDADNTLGGSGNYYDMENVLIDNLAPRVTVDEEQKNQAVDGTKSVNYTFNITDFSNSFKNDANIWARAYYCFVPDKDVMPSPDVSNIKSGELGTVIGQWAFVEGSSVTTTAVLKINKDASFKGRLYYFTTDSCNNDSRTEKGSVSSRDISVSNKDSVDTLVYTPSGYAKPSYEISFTDGGGKYKTEYHWIAKDTASDFSQNYTTYTLGADVGAAVQADSVGKKWTLDGVYTLEYKVTELSSGNYDVFTKDFTFDNSDNAINFSWSSTNMKPAEYQQASIQITDPSGIASASYQIVNPDNSVIDGYDEVELNLSSNPDGTMQVRETPQISPDKSGVYGIRITAKDNNGQTTQLIPDVGSEFMQFVIRTEKPTVVSVTDNVPNTGFTTDDSYTLDVSVEEPMLNAEFMSTDQIVKYSVSLDGINYSSWKTANGYMTVSTTGTAITGTAITSSAIKMTHSFQIVKPVQLLQGQNTIYVKTACMNVGDTNEPSNKLVSTAGKDIITCEGTSQDYEFGKITYRLSDTQGSGKPVTAYVTIIDEKNIVASAKVTDSNGQEYAWSEIIGNEYIVTFTKSGVYTVTAINDKGNTWTETITVNNIDSTLPEITNRIYSTPLNTITAKSVNVSLEFSKPDVKVTGIELMGSLTTSSAIVYTPGGTSIRFKQNCSVTVFFEDSQGNKNMDIVTVSNIYSDPPRLKAVAELAENKLSVKVTFKQDTNENGVPYDLFRELKDLYVFYGGVTYSADTASFNLKGNGVYKFVIYDKAGTTQNLELTVDEIDDSVPKITQVTWSYEYYKVNEQGTWDLKSDSKTIVLGVDTTGKEAGYVIADDVNPVTNQNVTVTVETDKPTTVVGSKDAQSNSTSMLYSENGLFNYNLQAVNGNNVSYGVDVEIIDKTVPVLTFTGGSELVFIEGMTPQKDSRYAYSIDKLMDYTAYDLKNGNSIDMTDRVTIDYGSFDYKNIEKNTFSRSNPYYINYKVYDDAGNWISVRRTIRLVGFYDTIALVNGSMPDSSNTATVAGDEMEISLKNFSGTSYAKYDKGTYTMGQMKTRGTQIIERDGKYTLSNLVEGWYTVYLQTDKHDYFTILVYVSNSKQ